MKLLLMTLEFPNTHCFFRRAWEFIDQKRYPYWQRWYWTQVHGLRLVLAAVAVTIHDYPLCKVYT